jgi:integrase
MPYKRKTNGKIKYVAQVIHHGQRHQKLCRTKKQAVEWEARKRHELEYPLPTNPLVSFSELCIAYLDYTKPRVSEETYIEKKRVLDHLLELWGDKLVDQITPSLVSTYLNNVARQRSVNASNRDRKNLHAVFTWGHKFLQVAPNPISHIDPLPHQRKPKYTPCRQDVLKVLSVATPQERVFLNCYLQTGARRSEVFRLKWSDIDFPRKTITLTTRKTRNGSPRRDILPMSDELRASLLWWEDWEGRKLKDKSHVFICDHPGPWCGKPFKVRRKFMRDLCERAEVKIFGFHALRRHVASYLADSGNVSIKAIQGLLRHQSLRTTERYVQRISSDLRDTVGMLRTESNS